MPPAAVRLSENPCVHPGGVIGLVIGALITAIYLIVSLSFGAPAVIAGVTATRFGLHHTTYAYGLVVMLLLTITTVAVWRSKAS